MQERIQRFFEHPFAAMLVALCITAFFAFFRLGANAIGEWDEAYYGELALQMITTGDWLNYHFGGLPDAWVAKPPLAVWAIALSYKVFGYHEFALRLPSALAIIGAFYFIFRMVQAYKGNQFAFFTVLVCVSINGLIGAHVGRTGDTDALLVLALMASTWHFLRFTDFGRQGSGIWMCFWLLIAFMTKGPTFAIFLTGWVAYSIFQKQIKRTLQSGYFWMGIIVLIGGISAWIMISLSYGTEFSDRPYLGENSVETMVLYDVWDRFVSSKSIEGKNDFTFILRVADVKYGVWIYATCILLLLTIVQKRFKAVFHPDANGRLNLFALLAWLPLAIFLTFAQSKGTWYFAPALPFLAIHTGTLIHDIQKRYKIMGIGVAILFLATLSVKTYRFSQTRQYDPFLTDHQEQFRQADEIVFYSRFPAHAVLYVNFQNPNVILQPDISKIGEITPDQLLVLNRDTYDVYRDQTKQLHAISVTDTYVLLGKTVP